MTKANAANERIKRDYFRFLGEAQGRDEATIGGVARSLARFEASTGRKDFKRFHREQAVAFKTKLGAAVNARTGDRLSKATLLTTLRDLRAFFMWLSREPGYRAHLHYADADYFNLSDKDVAVARARRDRPVPTLEQMRAVLAAMSADTLWERRDRALVAFAIVTGARVAALASFRLGHVDMASLSVAQDARVVRTKGAKSFCTFFMPVDERAIEIIGEWVRELTQDQLWGSDDPLFPSAQLGLDESGSFAPAGLSLNPWASSEPVREVFRRAFAAAGLPYFNPHSLRTMLVRHAMTLDLTPEEMKAWSQNLGHADVLTTFTSYGSVPTHRQGELVREIGRAAPEGGLSREQIAKIKELASNL